MSASIYIETKTFGRSLVDQETPEELAFYENCEVGDTANYSPYSLDCGIEVEEMLYCTRTPGHKGDRHVAEDITDVVAVSF